MNKHDLWIFTKYIVIEPFLQIKYAGVSLFRGVRTLKDVKSWIYIFMLLSVVFVLAKNKKMAIFSLFLLILTIIKYEWIAGDWRRIHLEKIKERAKQKHYAEHLREIPKEIKEEK